MPIYEYSCEKCGSRMEVMQKFNDAPPKRCKKCRGKLEKNVSRTSFQLKGAGWYMTDYPGKAAGAKNKAEGSSEGKSESAKNKTEGSTEGKSESALTKKKDSAGASAD